MRNPHPCAKYNYCLLLSYDGTHYLGWQKTKEGPSIEESLQACLAQILQHPVTLQAASRTDAGVHAEGQVVQFFSPKQLDCNRLRTSINALLPKDIAVFDVRSVPLLFHPTLLCQTKIYTYRCCSAPILPPHARLTTWHVPTVSLWEDMDKTCSLLQGSWDFAAFCNQKKKEEYENTVREILSFSFEQGEEGFFTFRIEGNRFLYKMVRNFVGTAVDVGRGKLFVQNIPRILAGKDRKQAGVTAPAHGLFLKQVLYPSSAFSEPSQAQAQRQVQKTQGRCSLL